jgi:MFS family permease
MVADSSPVELRGTAFGFFSLLSGLPMLLASGAAGLLWVHYGAEWTFYAGGVCCMLALIGVFLRPQQGA